MPNSGDNVRVEVLVNGERKVIAGVELFGAVTAILTWVRRDPAAAPVGDGAPTVEEWVENKTVLSVSGTSTCEHLRSLDVDLKAGDQVTLRVLAPGQFDLPVKIERQCERTRQ